MRIKLTATLLILFLPFFLYLFSGCCDCIDTEIFNYTNCSFEVKNLDHSGAEFFITEDTQVKKEAFGLQIQLNRKEDICQIRNPFLISTAYGTSCDCPPEVLYQPLDSIINISFITLQDFDNNNLTNSDITDYFQILKTTEYTSIADYLDNQIHILYNTTNFELTLNCLLLIPPTLSGDYQFQVKVELSDGRILSTTSESIQLL